jgi:hypothetical protein
MELGDTEQKHREHGAFDFALVPAQLDRAEAGRRALDFSDRPPRVRPKTSVLEWIGLVLAVLAPPLGLVVTIIARIITRYRHHWTTTVAKAATVISIVLTLVLAAGAVVYSVLAEEQAAEDRVLASAQPLCDALATTPGILDTPAYGWPTEVAPLPQTLEAMRAYQARWVELAALAPDAAKANLSAIAEQAGILVTAVETTQAIDRQGNLTKMSAVTGASGLPTWVTTYCG